MTRSSRYSRSSARTAGTGADAALGSEPSSTAYKRVLSIPAVFMRVLPCGFFSGLDLPLQT